MTNKQTGDEYYKKLMKDISDLGEYDPFCPVIKEHIHEIVKKERLKAINEKIEFGKKSLEKIMKISLYIGAGNEDGIKNEINELGDKIKQLQKQKEQFEK